MYGKQLKYATFYGKDLNNYITKTISKAVGFLAIGLIEKMADLHLKQVAST